MSYILGIAKNEQDYEQYLNEDLSSMTDVLFMLSYFKTPECIIFLNLLNKKPFNMAKINYTLIKSELGVTGQILNAENLLKNSTSPTEFSNSHKDKFEKLESLKIDRELFDKKISQINNTIKDELLTYFDKI